MGTLYAEGLQRFLDGHIVAAGRPEGVARAPDSVTGPWLGEHLGLLRPEPR